MSGETVCAVCLDQMDTTTGGSHNMTLGCGHAFHERCVLTWFISSLKWSCPVCRYEHTLTGEQLNALAQGLAEHRVSEHHMVLQVTGSTGAETALISTLIGIFQIYGSTARLEALSPPPDASTAPMATPGGRRLVAARGRRRVFCWNYQYIRNARPSQPIVRPLHPHPWRR